MLAGYWTGRRIGFIFADATISIGVVAIVAAADLWLGVAPAILVLAALSAIAFSRQARAIAMGGTANPILRTQRVVVLDSAGKPQACLDGTGLQLMDRSGKARILLSVDEDGPALQLLDKNGKLILNLGASAQDSTVGLTLADVHGRVRARALLKEPGVPSFGVYDEAGQLRAHLGMALERAGIHINDGEGNIVWTTP